jgi:hypothetical protein
MAHAAGNSTRASVQSHADSTERPKNLQAGGPLCPLAFERFDLVAARCELDCAHRAFRTRSSHCTAHRFFEALRRYRELVGGAR